MLQRKPSVALLAALLVSGLVVSAAALGGRTTSTSAAVVKTAFNKTLKRTIVVDGRGRTLYMWDSRHHPCTPACTKAWTPYATVAKPVAGKGIIASLLDTTPDGKQVRYNHHPLYHFRGGVLGLGPGDRKPGEIEGQRVYEVLYVLSPKGRPIRE